ncbi:hypothetical protein EJ08DRAFT_683895 [Tothia fuscella]|uniref:Membrane insertase YidC/Oxa/ALB C-terminal domain-containing protein n=1 Tax=Tothia fuscella TaxID=1048955 RepID=A0A9P4NFE0_9PEZI|nr:hypothetical protein EJ08DRAFT_683895 [Tothia fuscella]
MKLGAERHTKHFQTPIPRDEFLQIQRRPVTSQLGASRQLSTTSSPIALLQSRLPRHAYLSPPSRRIEVVQKASFVSWPWAKNSSPDFKDAHTPVSDVTREGTANATTASNTPSNTPTTPLSESSAAPVSSNTSTSIPNDAATASPVSSTPSSTPSPIEAPSPPPSTKIFDNLPDTIADASIQDFSKMTEHVGFMKEMGIDFGWGPTSIMQYLLENIHVYAGTPWWASVIIAALVLRGALFYPFFRATDEMAKMSAMKPELDRIKAKMEAATNKNDPLVVQQMMGEMSDAKKIAGLNTTLMFAPMVLQAVLGYGSFRLLRAMAALPVPGLQDGGFLWLTDLTVADPYFILPISMAAIMHILARLGGETGAAGTGAQSAITRPLLLWVLPGVMGTFLLFMPGVLQVSFFVASLWGLGQGYLFRSKWFRETMGLKPLIRPGSPATDVSTSANGISGPGKSGRSLKFGKAAPVEKDSLRRKLNIVPTAPMSAYQAPTVKSSLKSLPPKQKINSPAATPIPAEEKAKSSALTPVMNKWNDVKDWGSLVKDKSTETVEGFFGRKSGGASKRDKREMEQAIAYERRRKMERKHEEEVGRRMR